MINDVVLIISRPSEEDKQCFKLSSISIAKSIVAAGTRVHRE